MDKNVLSGDNVTCAIPDEKRNIVTSREKIINLRKEYKLTQDDLAGEDINRTLISYIETGKINLSEKTVEKIVRNVNGLFKRKGIKKRLKKEDLLVDYEKEVMIIVEEYIQILNRMLENNESIHNEVINEIEGFLFDKTVCFEKAEIYELIGDAIQNNESRNKCETFTYYSKALELYIVANRSDRLGNLVIKIARERVISREYDEAIKFMMFLCNSVGSIEKIEVHGDASKYMVYHYWAQACAGLEQYDTAIDRYKTALKFIEEDKEEEKATLILELGQCYVLSGDFDKGNNCFKNALRLFESNRNFNRYCSALNIVIGAVLKSTELDEDTKLFKLDQLANDMEFALKYVDSDYSELYMSYIMLGKGFKYLQRNTVAADYIRKAYGSIMKIGKLDLISVLVMQTYEIIKEMELAEELVNEDLINRITATQEKDEDLKNSVLALIGLLTENGHYDKALSLVSGLLEYSGIGK